MVNSPLSRYIAQLNKSQKPVPVEPRLSPMAAHWLWCREQAAAGWVIVLFVMALLFLFFSTNMEAAVGDLVRQCVGVVPGG